MKILSVCSRVVFLFAIASLVGCAAPPVTEGVACGSGVLCRGATPVCCVDLTAGVATSCVSSASMCSGAPAACDEQADCGGGRVCCLESSVTASGVTSRTSCATSCSQVELCQPVGVACGGGAGICCANGGGSVGVCLRGRTSCDGADAGP